MDELLADVDRWFPLALGVLLLVIGRRLFWLFLGVLGFLFAFHLVTRFAPESPPPLLWVLALGLGIAGAAAAIFLQRVAVGLAGLFFGGYATLWLLDYYALDFGAFEWVAILIGGLAIAALALAILEEALMVLSSVVGASLVVGSSGLDAVPGVILFAALVVVGVAVQSRWRGRRRKVVRA